MIRKSFPVLARFLGVNADESLKTFLKHLSWSVIGGVVGVGILFVINIVAGRILGPSGYGQYVLYYSYSLLLANLILLGFDTALIQKTKNVDTKDTQTKRNITAAFGALFCNFLILLVLYGVAAWYQFDSKLSLTLILAIGFLLALRNLSDAVLRAVHDFKKQAYVKTAEALVVAGIFLGVYFLYDKASYLTYLYALIASYVLYAVVVILLFVSPKDFQGKTYKELFGYARFAVVGGFAGFGLGYMDKLFLGHTVSAAELGLYNAYYVSSVTLVAQASILFINVLFPSLSKIGSKEKVLRKTHKLMVKMAPVLLIGFFLVTSVSFFFFGKNYPWHWLTTALFSLLAYLYLYFILIWWTIASDGERGARFTALHSAIAVLILGLSFALLLFFHIAPTKEIVALLQCLVLLYTVLVSYKFYQSHGKE